MDIIFKMFLTIHIIGGAIGLVTGILNMVAKKGDSKHKFIGKIFSISMYVAGISSLLLSVMNPSQFLFMVGIFTVYMVGTGNRYLSKKNIGKGQKPKIIDWTLTTTMLLTGLLLIGIGTLGLLKSNLFGLVLVTFGSLGLIFVRNDIKSYAGKRTTLNYWLTEHIQRMTGAFIASSTAFLVVNAKYFPESIPLMFYWLLPTVVLTPLIIKWSRKFEIKKK